MEDEKTAEMFDCRCSARASGTRKCMGDRGTYKATMKLGIPGKTQVQRVWSCE